MPIEFQCPACQATLRVPDSAIGKQAKCPRCGQIVTVVGAPPNEPDLGGGPAGPPPIGQPPVPPVPPDVNPYAPPQTPVSYLPPVDQGVIEPQIISFSDTFSTTWQMFFDNFGPFLGMGALLFGLTFIGNILMSVVNFTFVAMEDEAAFVVLGISMFILMLVMIAANMWLQGGNATLQCGIGQGYATDVWSRLSPLRSLPRVFRRHSPLGSCRVCRVHTPHHPGDHLDADVHLRPGSVFGRQGWSPRFAFCFKKHHARKSTDNPGAFPG
jgi:predicted Zn finger-like uncharacterized protein